MDSLSRRHILKSTAGLPVASLAGCLNERELPIQNIWLRVFESKSGLETYGVANFGTKKDAEKTPESYVSGPGAKDIEGISDISLNYDNPAHIVNYQESTLRETIEGLKDSYSEMTEPTPSKEEQIFYDMASASTWLSNLCPDGSSVKMAIADKSMSNLVRTSVERWSILTDQSQARQSYSPWLPPATVLSTTRDIYEGDPWIRNLYGFRLPNFAERTSSGKIQLNEIDISKAALPSATEEQLNTPPTQVVIQLPSGYRYFQGLSQNSKRIKAKSHDPDDRLASFLALERYKYRTLDRLNKLYHRNISCESELTARISTPFAETTQFLYDLTSAVLTQGACGILDMNAAVMSYAKDMMEYFNKLETIAIPRASLISYISIATGVDSGGCPTGVEGSIPVSQKQSEEIFYQLPELPTVSCDQRPDLVDRYKKRLEIQKTKLGYVKGATNSGLVGIQMPKSRLDYHEAQLKFTRQAMDALIAVIDHQESLLDDWAAESAKGPSSATCVNRIKAGGFSFEPERRAKIHVRYNKTRTHTYNADNLRLIINSSEYGKRTYLLSEVVSDHEINPGDVFTLTGDILGLSGEILKDDLIITLESKFDSGWHEIDSAEYEMDRPTDMPSGEFFEIDPMNERSLVLRYKSSGSNSYPVDQFQVTINNAGAADGVYPLSELTSESSFRPSDKIILNESSLGSKFRWQDSTVVLSFKTNEKWKPILEVKFSIEGGAGKLPSGESFSINPETESSLVLRYKSTAKGSYSTDRFYVKISNAGGANGTYPLTSLTANSAFEPGDTVTLNKSTLGLDSKFDWQESTVTLYITLDGNRQPLISSDFRDKK